MKIIKWLRKVAQEPPSETSAIASSPTNNKKESNSVAAQSKEVVSLNHHKGDQRQKKRAEKTRFGCKNFDLFTFSNGLNLKRVLHTMKMKQGMNYNNKGSEFAAVHVGNTKVLPINDAAIALSSSQKCGMNEDKRDDQKVKTEKTKTFSKMKELLRWAAATKAEKGGGKYIHPKVLQYRKYRETLKDDDKLSRESSKMSFRWDMESCSTNSSSVFSTLSASSSTRDIDQTNMNMPANSTSITRTGNWITTDSEFVVLEL